MLKNGSHSAHELQRQKVLTQSVYGIWEDVDRTIELKVSPKVGGAKIKVWSVRHFSAIEKISAFCGLNATPKRTRWQGFDLITNLEKDGDESFINGVVNMPNNRRRNSAEFRVLGNTGYLEFYYYDFGQKEIRQNKSGSILLTQHRRD